MGHTWSIQRHLCCVFQVACTMGKNSVGLDVGLMVKGDFNHSGSNNFTLLTSHGWGLHYDPLVHNHIHTYKIWIPFIQIKKHKSNYPTLQKWSMKMYRLSHHPSMSKVILCHWIFYILLQFVLYVPFDWNLHIPLFILQKLIDMSMKM